nr:hypothetical protein mPipKuh1_010669 [Pipistrellus kuhlii]
MTEGRGILPGICSDLETILKTKWLTPKKHVFRNKRSNGVKEKPDARRFVQEWAAFPLTASTFFALAGATFPRFPEAWSN